MYRSGDLARYLPDGDVEFLGRTDFQVKIRGLRVELGEIEHALTSHPSVREAIVLLREDRPGTKQLTAYVVSARTDEAALEHELRTHLAGALPAYMLPDLFVRLAGLPLTSNGKVDRKALPAPAAPVLRSRAPQGDAERALAEVWKGVLGLTDVGVDDNFFSLGGDSIRSTQMIARARRHGYDFTVRDVLTHPTIAALAALARLSPMAAVPAPTMDDRTDRRDIPLLPMQHWLFESGGKSARFNQAVVLHTAQPLATEPLREAFADVVARHEALRLRFSQATGGRQVAMLVSPAEAAIHLGADAPAFDVEAGPMMSAHVSGDTSSVLTITAHHLIVDGVSWRTLMEDLETAYGQLCAGQPVKLLPKTASFQQWAGRLVEFAKSEALRGELDFWRGLSAAEPPPLPKAK